jgi:hypothetical protein
LIHTHYHYDQAFLNYTACTQDTNRVRVVAFGAGVGALGVARTLERVIRAVVEVAKIAFSQNVPQQLALCGLNILGLVVQPIQAAVHFVAALVGIISPQVAYQMMKASTIPLAAITAQETKLAPHDSTPNAIQRKILDYLDDLDVSFALECALKTLFTEFPFAFSTGITAPLGLMLEPFHLFNANPEALSDEQKAETPILLLNGNFSHQGNFLPLLHYLELTGNTRPVYTINLPPMSINPHPIIDKVEEIKQQYGKSDDAAFQIDLVGHSQGSGCMQQLIYEQYSFSVRRAIALGAPYIITPSRLCSEPLDITGTDDLLIPSKSRLPAENRQEIHTGHLGLLFHSDSLATVATCLGK